MKITILTLFPNQFQPFIETSIIGRAAKRGLINFQIIDLRPFGQGKHLTVDGRPYGGGPGMILKADVLSKAVQSVTNQLDHPYIILTSPSGKTLNQATSQRLVKLSHIMIICGHYEGVDQRFIDQLVDEEISIGDYVLTGGEIPAMVIAETVARLVPGVLSNQDTIKEESFTDNLLEYPQYTKPSDFQGNKIPSVLLSGHHQQIADWRRVQAISKTKKVRPDLLKK